MTQSTQVNNKLSKKMGPWTPIPNDLFNRKEFIDLSTSAKWLFVVLSYHANRDTDVAWPGYKVIQEETGFAKQTVTDAIKDLKNAGLIYVSKRFGTSQLYHLRYRPP